MLAFLEKTIFIFLRACREILRFGELQEERISILNCLLLLDGVEVPEELYNSSVRIVRVSSIVMKKLSGLQSIDSIEAVALMSIPSSFCSIDDNQEEANCQSWFPSPHRILVLDGIQVMSMIIPVLHILEETSPMRLVLYWFCRANLK